MFCNLCCSVFRVVYKSQQLANFAYFSARFHRLLLHESRYVNQMMFIRSHNRLLFTKLWLLKNLKKTLVWFAIILVQSKPVPLMRCQTLSLFFFFKLTAGNLFVFLITMLVSLFSLVDRCTDRSRFKRSDTQLLWTYLYTHSQDREPAIFSQSFLPWNLSGTLHFSSPVAVPDTM